MKSSLGKLRRLALQKSDAKDKSHFLPSAHLDEITQAARDMQEMRNCYDGLLSAAAATANSAYEFSESLREMGACLVEKTMLHDNEESGNVLLMLGKVQFELQKLVDSYRAHILMTITNPSESLLNDLRTVEEMKIQCDEKRDVYEYMMAQQREKGRSKSGKGENITVQKLQAAHEEYNEEASQCVFRFKSLKQGHSRSLLTQAVRHHVAQLTFFRRGLKSLEAVEPHVICITEQHHIDYQFSGLEDDGEDGEDDGENSYSANDARESSFDYKPNNQGLDGVSMSKTSMEVDEVGRSIPQVSTTEITEMSLDKNQEDVRVSSREPRVGSHSAPIYAEKKFKNMKPVSTHTYVLPTPVSIKASSLSRGSSAIPQAMQSGCIQDFWYSPPLENKMLEKDTGNGSLSGHTILKSQSVLKESNSNTSIALPPPLAHGVSLPHLDAFNALDTRKIKRQAFSGPFVSKPGSTRPVLSASGPIVSTELPQVVSGMISRLPIPQPSSSPKVSPSASPPRVSSPKLSELHELPRPPGSKPAMSPGLLGHSASVAFRNQEPSGINKIHLEGSIAASPLPIPPLVVPRSFSNPSSSQRAMAIHVAKLLDSPQVPGKAK